MNVEVKNGVRGFAPLTLTIEVESEEELRMLWHRFNVGSGSMVTGDYLTRYRDEHKITSQQWASSGSDVWSTIDDACEARGIGFDT